MKQCYPPLSGTAGGTVPKNQGSVSRECRLIENALIVCNMPSSGLRRAQEGIIFDQDPTNDATTDNDVASQA